MGLIKEVERKQNLSAMRDANMMWATLAPHSDPKKKQLKPSDFMPTSKNDQEESKSNELNNQLSMLKLIASPSKSKKEAEQP